MSARQFTLPAERSLIDDLLHDQQTLTAVERFSSLHSKGRLTDRYSALMPARGPAPGEQYRFEVNLDACTGCKACVSACHSLNGLDDNESFRDTGLILADDYQQTVTTACHQCADPACANGCPVGAYEKDATTGIVRHLDDQCIGCQYCLLKCPYEVPKYNARLGIVRKCDMCSQRLAVGEAPACVQACPTSAITIRLVDPSKEAARLVPGSFDPAYTRPTTRYHTARGIPDSTRAADGEVLRVQPAHWPLVAMLLLTQLAAGWFLVGISDPRFSVPACIVLHVGLAASVLHLGRPLGAWRFFLGLKKSWMSREILAFSLLSPPAAWLAANRIFPLTDWAHRLTGLGLFEPKGPVQSALPSLTAGLALLAVFTSCMIYIDTHRSWWRPARTLPAFFASTLISGLALTQPMAASILGLCYLPAILLTKIGNRYSTR
ncbi:MAG: molybdopterin oxidoreductase, partial [Verrucomicrobiales bacterium]|nr:molybdopterin oxidoreductase [Verrucomicrobiales bacterium]